MALPPQPTASAGVLVNEDAAAAVPQSRVVNPEQEQNLRLVNGRIQRAPDTNSATTAIQAEIQLPVTGTAPTISLNNSQSTSGLLSANPALPPQTPLTNPQLDGRELRTGGAPGAAAGNDDSSRRVLRQELVTLGAEQQIESRPNVLDVFSSYTYSISLYLLTEQSFARIRSQEGWNLDGVPLLIQSAGAPVGSRSPYFGQDYYIDELTVESIFAGRGTRAAHNATTIKMKIVEPNGITLVRNLDRAVQELLGPTKGRNWGAVNYLLVVRFYGYDEAGNISSGKQQTPAGTTDRNAVIEKYFPIQIGSIKFQIANKVVEYDLEGIVAGYNIALGSAHATVPYNIEINGQTVQEILGGAPEYSATNAAVSLQATNNTRNGSAGRSVSGPTAQQLSTLYTGSNSRLGQNTANSAIANTSTTSPSTAAAAQKPTLTLRRGLIDAMNQYQKDLVRDGKRKVANVYEVEYVGTAIPSAKVNISSPINVDRSNTPMAIPSNARDALNPATSRVDVGSRIHTIMAGRQMSQILDQILRNSEYIKLQQTGRIAEEGPNSGQIEPNPTPRPTAWFKISVEATPLEFDTISNEYAYRIKYIISPYEIFSAPPPWFSPPGFRGVHKRFEYWFTGNNTSILDLTLDINNQYYHELTGGVSQRNNTPVAGYNDIMKYSYAPRSLESSQQARGAVNEPAASLASHLYNPGDLTTIKMTIIGDPSFMQQGEAAGKVATDNANFLSPFLNDGTINFDSSSVLFSVEFNRPEDYNLDTGLIDLNFAVRRSNTQLTANEKFIYVADKVTNMFSRGGFRQNLSGWRLEFPQPGITGSNQRSIANRSVVQTGTLFGPTLSTPLYSTPVVEPLPGSILPSYLDFVPNISEGNVRATVMDDSVPGPESAPIVLPGRTRDIPSSTRPRPGSSTPVPPGTEPRVGRTQTIPSSTRPRVQ